MAAGDVVWPVFALFEVRGKGGAAGSFTREEGGVTETVSYGTEYRLERYEGGDEDQVYQVTVRPSADRVNVAQFDETAVERGDFVQVVGEAIINPGSGKGRFKLTAMIGPVDEAGQPKKGSKVHTAAASA